MNLFPLKATSTYVKAYYAALKQFHEHGHTTEGNTRSAFEGLLRKCASAYDWMLVTEYQFKGTGKQPLRADGALVDSLTLVHGLWEAKDSADDLQREIKSKVAKGYPLNNILFQSPDRAVLYPVINIRQPHRPRFLFFNGESFFQPPRSLPKQARILRVISTFRRSSRRFQYLDGFLDSFRLALTHSYLLYPVIFTSS